MDAQDIRIFCALAVSGPPDAVTLSEPRGVGRVARSLGLDEKTVRSRMRRLEDEGFIKYYQAAPDLALLGMRSEVTCRIDAVNVATKLAALAYCQGQAGMVEALDFIGPSFVVTFAGSTANTAREAHRALVHRFEMERFEQGVREMDVPSQTLPSIDWRIIQRMRYDARAPVSEVAASLGLTPRMVRYRLERIRASRAVSIRPMLDARRLRGLVVYRLVVVPAPGEGEGLIAPLRRHLGQTNWAVRRSLAGPILLDMFGTGLLDPEESATRALEVPGVEACNALILKEILEPTPESWVDRAIVKLARE